MAVIRPLHGHFIVTGLAVDGTTHTSSRAQNETVTSRVKYTTFEKKRVTRVVVQFPHV
jgi:hypothetical protein